MKKHFVWVLVLILVLTHLVSPGHVSFAEETKDECKMSEFTIQTIVVNDKKIEGTGLSGQTLELEFVNKKDMIYIDPNGKFEYPLETDELVENDKIIISNDYSKIETNVVGEEASVEQIKSEHYVECLVEETPEEQTEEASQENTTEKEVEEQIKDTPQENAEKEVIEEQIKDTPQENAEKEVIEEQTKEIPQKDTQKESLEEQTKEAATEDSTDKDTEIKRQEEAPEEDTQPKDDTRESIAKNFSILPEGQAEEVYQSSRVPINSVQGSSVTVGTSQQFTDALSNNEVEQIKLSNNITTSGTLNVRTRYGQKIIDANGYSINLGSGHLALSNSSTSNSDVRKFIILNTSNLYSSNTGNNSGMIRKTADEVSIHFENVNFNINNNTAGGILGSSWEGNINFYGNNIINTYSGNYSMAFRKVFIHSGANVEINNYNGNSVFKFVRATKAYGDDEYGLQVEKSGTLTINSNAAVITTDLSRPFLANRPLTNRFGIDSKVVLSGVGRNVFSGDTTVNNFITNPKRVDLVNQQPTGALFNSSQEINFSLTDTTLKGWNQNNMSNQPSNSSQAISNGQFRFSGNNTTNVALTPPQPNFSTKFTPQLRRMIFEESIPPIELLEVDQITDVTKEITGRTAPNVSVRMFDRNNNVIQTVQSNSTGKFIFDLKEPFKANTLLRFKSYNEKVESKTVEKTVIGNRLEFVDVPKTIPFNSTKIQDKEMIIERENPNMTVAIMDTRSNSDWHVTIKALAPLTDSNNNPLNEALYYIEGNNEKLIENEAVWVGEKDQSSNSDVQEFSWSKGEGILLKLNPITAQADTEYSTTIEWTLTDGP